MLLTDLKAKRKCLKLVRDKDGEREVEIQNANTRISVRLDPRGPRLIDVDAALAAGAAVGAFVRTRCHRVDQAGV